MAGYAEDYGSSRRESLGYEGDFGQEGRGRRWSGARGSWRARPRSGGGRSSRDYSEGSWTGMEGGYAESGRNWNGEPGDYRRGEGRGFETWSRDKRDYDRSGGNWSGSERGGQSGRGWMGGEQGYRSERGEGSRRGGSWRGERSGNWSGEGSRSGGRDRWESGTQGPFSGRERWRSRYGSGRPYEGEPLPERPHGRSLHYDLNRSRQDEQHEDLSDRLRDAWHRFTSEVGGLFERSRDDYDRDYRER